MKKRTTFPPLLLRSTFCCLFGESQRYGLRHECRIPQETLQRAQTVSIIFFLFIFFLMFLSLLYVMSHDYSLPMVVQKLRMNESTLAHVYVGRERESILHNIYHIATGFHGFSNRGFSWITKNTRYSRDKTRSRS